MPRNKLGQFTSEDTGSKSLRWTGGKSKWGIELTCAGCDVKFRTHRQRYNNSKTKIFYCGRECQKKHSKVNMVCVVCGKEKSIYRSDLKIKNRGQFCSQKCARSQAPKLDQSSQWKGGRAIMHGYVYLYAPYHPNCHKNGYVPEHRLVMEKHLGRLLEPHEHIHHVNGNTQENYIENLELTSNSEHSSHHNDIRWGNKKEGRITLAKDKV